MTQPVLFRLPDELVARLDHAARADGGRSRNSLAWSILDKALSNSASVELPLADSGVPENTPRALPMDPGRRRRGQQFPETVAQSPLATAAPGSANGLPEPGALHVAHAQRQADAKAAQRAEHDKRRAEAVAATIAGLDQ